MTHKTNRSPTNHSCFGPLCANLTHYFVHHKENPKPHLNSSFFFLHNMVLSSHLPLTCRHTPLISQIYTLSTTNPRSPLPFHPHCHFSLRSPLSSREGDNDVVGDVHRRSQAEGLFFIPSTYRVPHGSLSNQPPYGFRLTLKLLGSWRLTWRFTDVSRSVIVVQIHTAMVNRAVMLCSRETLKS
jgi:hypothetical protein